ncbi:hypothetical protein LSH36_474g03020 [Paralvinella palmiformis]|uniref:Uncharacterized protein n=1 Tax=Paralvinella palmiformis TaxID=53620 RepID=A0AAD9MYJ5_9ANNE|nr:hypothetical protein LSH36_474g03020 [Paralvinella palmiformis]
MINTCIWDVPNRPFRITVPGERMATKTRVCCVVRAPLRLDGAIVCLHLPMCMCASHMPLTVQYVCVYVLKDMAEEHSTSSNYQASRKVRVDSTYYLPSTRTCTHTHQR